MNTRPQHSDVNHLELTQSNALLHMFELTTKGGCQPLTVLETLTSTRMGTLKQTKRRTIPGSMTEVQRAIVESLPETNSIRVQVADKVSVE